MQHDPNKAAAQKSLFTEIQKLTDEVGAGGLHANPKATALRDLALAYRLVAGGPQPGGIASKD